MPSWFVPSKESIGFIFDEDTVEQTIKLLRPTIHAKGTDYTADTVKN